MRWSNNARIMNAFILLFLSMLEVHAQNDVCYSLTLQDTWDLQLTEPLTNRTLGWTFICEADNVVVHELAVSAATSGTFVLTLWNVENREQQSGISILAQATVTQLNADEWTFAALEEPVGLVQEEMYAITAFTDELDVLAKSTAEEDKHFRVNNKIIRMKNRVVADNATDVMVWTVVEGLLPAYGMTDIGYTCMPSIDYGDCMVFHSQPGCSNQEIQDCVCAADDYCCDGLWDSGCVNLVINEDCIVHPAQTAAPAPFETISPTLVPTVYVSPPPTAPPTYSPSALPTLAPPTAPPTFYPTLYSPSQSELYLRGCFPYVVPSTGGIEIECTGDNFIQIKVMINGIEIEITVNDAENAFTFEAPGFDKLSRQYQLLEFHRHGANAGTRLLQVDESTKTAGRTYLLEVVDTLSYYSEARYISYATVDATAAVCLEEGRYYSKKIGCINCPEGAYCPGGSFLWPTIGHWSIDEYSVPGACQAYEACPGVDDFETNPDALWERDNKTGLFSLITNNCNGRYSGEFCSECTDGTYHDRGVCRKCNDDGVAYFNFTISIIFASVWWVLLTALVVAISIQNLCKLIYAIMMLQYVVHTLYLGSLGMEDGSEFFRMWGFINFQVDFLNWDCNVGGLGGYPLWATIVFVGAVGLMFTVAAYHRHLVFLSTVDKSTEREAYSPRTRQRAYSSAKNDERGQKQTLSLVGRLRRVLLILMHWSFLQFSTRVMEAVYCVTVGETSRLKVDYRVDCEASGYLPTYVICWIFLIGYVMATPPLWTSYLYKRNKFDQLFLEDGRVRSYVLGIAFAYTKRGFYWFTSTFFFVDFAIALCVTFSPDVGTALFLSGVILTTFINLALGLLKPYQSRSVNRYTYLTGFSSVLMSAICLLFIKDHLANENNTQLYSIYAAVLIAWFIVTFVLMHVGRRYLLQTNIRAHEARVGQEDRTLPVWAQTHASVEDPETTQTDFNKKLKGHKEAFAKTKHNPRALSMAINQFKSSRKKSFKISIKKRISRFGSGKHEPAVELKKVSPTKSATVLSTVHSRVSADMSSDDDSHYNYPEVKSNFLETPKTQNAPSTRDTSSAGSREAFINDEQNAEPGGDAATAERLAAHERMLSSISPDFSISDSESEVDSDMDSQNIEYPEVKSNFVEDGGGGEQTQSAKTGGGPKGRLLTISHERQMTSISSEFSDSESDERGSAFPQHYANGEQLSAGGEKPSASGELSSGGEQPYVGGEAPSVGCEQTQSLEMGDVPAGGRFLSHERQVTSISAEFSDSGSDDDSDRGGESDFASDPRLQHLRDERHGRNSSNDSQQPFIGNTTGEEEEEEFVQIQAEFMDDQPIPVQLEEIQRDEIVPQEI